MNRRCVSLVTVILLAAAYTPDAVCAQSSATENDNNTRPRIGLVLGGGGARGAAHIGVLKELERLHIPVDAIAGTSIGAVIGGLYAIGMSADDLEQLVSSLDWAAALSDGPVRKDMSFRRKQDDREFPIDFDLGLRGTELLLPKGVIQGQRLDLLLRKLTMHASPITDFDDLPIPFRAVASDIVAGEAVILGSGDLAMALRASMSVPGVIAPASIDGRLLVDGGITGNLPIDVMKAMGVDIIIAVDVEFPLYKAEELESVVAISEQVLTIMISRETKRQIDTLADSDILLRPELGDYPSADFANITAAIQPGQEAAHQQASRLQVLSLPKAEWVSYLARRELKFDDSEKLAFVRVAHDGKLAPEVLASRLSVHAGDRINADILAQNANRLYGLALYEHVGYRLVDEGGGTGVEYDAVTKSWGPNFLQFGVSLEDDFEGSTGFNLAARMTRAGLNRLGAEWRTDLKLGTDPELQTEFYQPLSFDSRLFIAPRLALRQSNLNAFAMNKTVARYRVSESELSLDVGRELGTVGEFRLGAYRGIGDASVKVGDPVLPDFSFDTGGVFAGLSIDSMDNSHFPREGTLANLRWNLSRPGMGADFKFDTIKGDFAQTWSHGKNSLQLGLSYATTLSSDNTVQDFFPLGGFLRLSGLERGEISGPHSALARLVYYRQVGDTTGDLFEIPIYLGFSAEAGNVWNTRAEMSLHTMQINGSVFAGMDSYFGPVYLAAGFAEHGQTNFYLFIGAPPR